MVSLNDQDWEEYWNTKAMSNNGFHSKKMKLELSKD